MYSLYILIILCCITSVIPQQAAYWEGKNAQPIVCRDFIPEGLKVPPPGWTVEQSSNRLLFVAGETALFGAKAVELVGTGYILGVFSLYCSVYLPAAYDYGGNITKQLAYPLPMNPCRSVCDNFAATSTAYLLATGYPVSVLGYGLPQINITFDNFPLNCSEWVTTYPELELLFPIEGYNATVPWQNETVFVPCYNPPNVTKVVIQGCQGSEVYQNGLSCYVNCPMLPDSHDQYDGPVQSLQWSMGMIGLISSLTFLALSIMAAEIYGTFPGYHLTFMNGASMVLCVAIMATWWFGKENMWCNGGISYELQVLQSGGTSLIQSKGAADSTIYVGSTSNYVEVGFFQSSQGFCIYMALLVIPYSSIMIIMSLIPPLITPYWFTLCRWITGKDVQTLFIKQSNLHVWKFEVSHTKHLFLIGYLFIILMSIALAASESFKYSPGATFAFLDATNETSLIVGIFIVPMLLLTIVLSILSFFTMILFPSFLKNEWAKKDTNKFIRMCKAIGKVRHVINSWIISANMIVICILFIYEGVYFGQNVNNIINEYCTQALLYGNNNPFIDQTPFNLGMVLSAFILMLPILQALSSIIGWLIFTNKKKFILSRFKYCFNVVSDSLNSDDKSLKITLESIVDDDEQPTKFTMGKASTTEDEINNSETTSETSVSSVEET